MPVQAYVGERFSRTHENKAFDRLLASLEEAWGESEEPVVLLGNFFCDHAELDAMVVKRNSITVIDLKSYKGKLTFSENGRWTADGVEVKGGSKPNPFKQIRSAKYSFKDWIERRSNLARVQRQNLYHVSGLALFDGPIEMDEDDLPPNVASWFHITDLAHCARVLSQIASPEINLSAEDIAAIPAALELTPYTTVAVEVASAGSPQVLPPVDSEELHALARPLQAVLEALASSSSRVVTVRGMVGTGIDRLADLVVTSLRKSGRPVIRLAPNRRLAEHVGSGASSVYSYLFSKTSRVEGDLDVFHLAPNDDADDVVYLLTDAHLVSDDPFEFDGMRYGSGRLLSDLSTFVREGGGCRQAVFLGDPFQIARGRADESALVASRVGKLFGCEVREVDLGEVLQDQASRTTVRNAQFLAERIRAGVFNELAFQYDDQICVHAPVGHERPPALVDFFRASPDVAKFIAFSNQSVNAVNAWVRKEVFGREGDLAPGDVVQVHNPVMVRDPDDPTRTVYVSNNAFAVVRKVLPDAHPITQPLKGRAEPIIVALGKARVQLLDEEGHETELAYVKAYLHSERPELAPDMVVALRVHAQSRLPKGAGDDTQGIAGPADADAEVAPDASPYMGSSMNIAYMRFGYALTLHKAQGHQWPLLWADLDTGQAKTNEAYFRWLYTVFAVAAGRIVLDRASPFTPVSHMAWDESRAQLGPVKPKNLVPLPVHEPAQFSEVLVARVSAAAAAIGLRVEKKESLQYCERLTLSGPNGRGCRLSFTYNGKREVTGIQKHESSPEGTADEVAQLCTGARFDNAFQEQVCGLLVEKLEPSGFSLVSVEHHAYKEVYYLECGAGRVRADVDYDGDGFVKRLAPTAYSHASVLDQLRRAVAG